MNIDELLRWQWQGYPRNHQTRGNLLLHIVLVPLFLAGNVAFVAGVGQLSWHWVVAGAIATIVSIALQERGHKNEPHSPEPFTGVGNALSRILLEQWVTFPRFVVSGGLDSCTASGILIAHWSPMYDQHGLAATFRLTAAFYIQRN